MYSFVETRLFTRLVNQYLADESYCELQSALIANKNLGAVIRGSGGVRKLRWAAKGKGKRGGVRVICFIRKNQGEIWMLTLYSKNVTDSIPGHVLKQIREEIEGSE